MILLLTLISSLVGLGAVGTGIHWSKQQGLQLQNAEDCLPEINNHYVYSNRIFKRFKKILNHHDFPRHIAIKILEIAVTEIIDLYSIIQLIEMSKVKVTSRYIRNVQMSEDFLQLLDKIDFSVTVFASKCESNSKYIAVFKQYHFQYISTKQIQIILEYKTSRNSRIPAIIFAPGSFPCIYSKIVKHINLEGLTTLFQSATDLRMSLTEYGIYLSLCSNIHPDVTSLSLDIFQDPIVSEFPNRSTFDEKVESLESYNFQNAFHLNNLTLVVGSLLTNANVERMLYALDHLVSLKKLTIKFSNLCSVDLNNVISKKMNKVVTDHLQVNINFKCIQMPDNYLTPTLLSRDMDYAFPEECAILHSKFESLIVQLQVFKHSFSSQFFCLKKLILAVFPGNISELIKIPYMPSVVNLQLIGGFPKVKKMHPFGTIANENPIGNTRARSLQDLNTVLLDISKLVNLTHFKLQNVNIDVTTINTSASTVTHLTLVSSKVCGGKIKVSKNLKFLKVYDSLARFTTPHGKLNSYLKISLIYDINKINSFIKVILKDLSSIIREVIIHELAEFPEYVQITYLPSLSSLNGPGINNYFFIIEISEGFQSSHYYRYFNKSFELNIFEMPLLFESYNNAIVNICRSFLSLISASSGRSIAIDQAKIIKPTKFTLDYKFKMLFRYTYPKLYFNFTQFDSKLVIPPIYGIPIEEKLL